MKKDNSTDAEKLLAECLKKTKTFPYAIRISVYHYEKLNQYCEDKQIKPATLVRRLVEKIIEDLHAQSQNSPSASANAEDLICVKEENQK
jgi:predicted DNA-binding protein